MSSTISSEDGPGLAPAEALRFYDRLGALQDLAARFEGPVVRDVTAHMELGSAVHVVEVGCGTGALAQRLLRDELPAHATYTGIDISAQMLRLTHRRISHAGERVRLIRTNGKTPLPLPTASADRVLCCFVLDLMPTALIDAHLAEFARILQPGGRLGIANMHAPAPGAAGWLGRQWMRLQRRKPAWVGGCRPIDPASRVDGRLLLRQHGLRHETLGIALGGLVFERTSHPPLAGSPRPSPPE